MLSFSVFFALGFFKFGNFCADIIIRCRNYYSRKGGENHCTVFGGEEIFARGIKNDEKRGVQRKGKEQYQNNHLKENYYLFFGDYTVNENRNYGRHV